MAVTTVEAEYKRLRSYLNPSIKGPAVDAVLLALATGNSSYLVNNLRAVNDQMYISSASGRYLDERLADYGIVRPPNIGLSDDVFREIGIQVKNRKQVRDLVNQLLDSIFGDEFVRATNSSNQYEPYALRDGDTLQINFDAKTDAVITFNAADFSSIGAATAQEVADAITKSLRSQGLTGTAIARNDGNGPYVELLSDTIGASSSVTVTGGRVQNELIFDSVVPAGGNLSTQWTLSLQPGGFIRYTWTGGANPQLGKLTVGNYANIYGGGFTSSADEGSFPITDFKGGVAGVAYFQIYNPAGTSGIITQGDNNAILFFNPVKKTIASKLSYAAVYQTEARMVQIFLPAATKVVRRDRVGSAHIHDQSDAISLLPGQEGPYSYDLTQPFTISDVATTLTSQLDGTMSRVIAVTDASKFPDAQGYLILGYGTEIQEGPIPYIARPSDGTLLISPAYTIKGEFPAGTDVSFVAQKSSVVLSQDGLDYPFYVTDVVSGRQYAQDLIKSIAATGITILFTIVYPNSIGLGKWGTVYDENPTIWGNDLT